MNNNNKFIRFMPLLSNGQYSNVSPSFVQKYLIYHSLNKILQK